MDELSELIGTSVLHRIEKWVEESRAIKLEIFYAQKKILKDTMSMMI